jgi:Tfp pilus assembly protein PilV
MRTNQTKHNTALTLIEVMVVVLIIAVAVIGAMGFRFYCVADAKKADVQAGAARIGSMLLESWKGTGGLSNYNPTTQFSAFTSRFEIKQEGTSNNYWVHDKANSVTSSDGIHYYVTLSRTAPTSTSLAVLNVTVAWRKTYSDNTSAGNPIVHTISLATYAD